MEKSPSKLYQAKLVTTSSSQGKQTEVESRTQGSRPRTQKNSRLRTALPKTDPLEAKDRNSQGPGTKKTGASFLQTQKKVFKIFFRRSPKKGLQKFIQAIYTILTIQKIVLSSSRGQGNFRGLEALRPRPSP